MDSKTRSKVLTILRHIEEEVERGISLLNDIEEMSWMDEETCDYLWRIKDECEEARGSAWMEG